jgi:reactive chlorine resistance protein C
MMLRRSGLPQRKKGRTDVSMGKSSSFMNTRNVAPRSEGGEAGQALGDLGMVVLRSALAGTLLWVGALKFVEYEAEQIQPMVSTSPLFSRINRMLGKRKLAGLIGATEMVLGALIAARPLSPKASALGSLGATAMFVSTLSFILSMPGVWHEEHGFPALSMEGQFLAKDGVLLGAAIVTAAEALRGARGA